MKKLNIKLLSFLCVVIILCSFIGIKLISNVFVSNVSAEEDNKYDGTDLKNELLTCGTYTTDAIDKELAEKMLGANFNLTISVDKDNINLAVISVDAGEFESDDSASKIKSDNYGFISAIHDASGHYYDGDEHIVVSPDHKVYLDLLAVDASEFDSENNTESMTRNIKFHLYKDYYVEENGNKYGCVSAASFAALESKTDEISNHPTLKGKPNGKDYGTYSVIGYFDVVPNGGGSTSAKVENPYYYTYCADFRGETSNYLSSEILEYRNKLFEFYNNSGNADELKALYLNSFPDCKSGSIYVVPDEATFKNQVEETIKINYKNLSSTSLDSDKDLAWLDDKLFDEIRKNGKKVDNPSQETFNLKCKTSGSGDFNSNYREYIEKDGKSVYNIEANTEYYYTKKEEKDETIYFDTEYTRFSDGKQNTGQIPLGTCQKTCEEAVVVNYGPPIAATAGLCFEYQVQVTSKIKCSTSTTFNQPELSLCNPYPHCNYYYGLTAQGGPDDEFEMCIQKCDGGKYSEKCSEKCYNEVYSKSSSTSNKQSYNPDDVLAMKVGNPYGAFPGYDGEYRVTSGGGIVWCSKGDCSGNSGQTYSRWYKQNQAWKTEHDHIYTDAGHQAEPVPLFYTAHHGFKKAVHGRASNYTNLCHDNCQWWGTCGTNAYYNQTDLDNAITLYQQAKDTYTATCKAEASCTTRTAKFTISVDYSHYTAEQIKKLLENPSASETPIKETIQFPYSTNDKGVANKTTNDLVSSKDENGCSKDAFVKCTPFDKSQGLCDDTTKNADNIILKYAGCYKNCANDIAYHTRWSFPGGWESNKTDELTWQDQEDNTWAELKDKYCLRKDVLPVNSSYWEYYVGHLSDSEIPSFLDKEVYADGNPYKNVTNFYVDEYNIHASATDFGHYGWNFNIDCFYSVHNNGTTTDGCKDGTCTERVEIKTVDLRDLFPSWEGDKTWTDDSTKTYSVPDKDIPFNWSSRATQNNDAIKTAKFDPTVYGKYVQTKGYSIYNDDELEYHFHLTPSDMRAFQKSSYKLYDNAKFTTSKGIGAFESSLFRNGGILESTVKKIPDVGLLGCNNIKSGSCYTTEQMASGV